MPEGAHLRVDRPTGQLDRLATMYREGLGFKDLGSFRDHDGFDGVMLGHAKHGHHLELTHENGRPSPSTPDPENLLVFYMPDPGEWEEACVRMTDAGFKTLPSHNPYRNARGRTFKDPDGYRVVLQNAAWP